MNTNPIINGVECVTIKTAASLIGCSYSRMAWLISKSMLTPIVPGTHEKFLPIADIEQFRAALKRGPKPKT